MVTPYERKLVWYMVKLKLWQTYVGMRVICIAPRFGTKWVFNWLRKRQSVDDYHHAPACPANHWCMQRLVFTPCNCGAAFYAQKDKSNDE